MHNGNRIQHWNSTASRPTRCLFFFFCRKSQSHQSGLITSLKHGSPLHLLSWSGWIYVDGRTANAFFMLSLCLEGLTLFVLSLTEIIKNALASSWHETETNIAIKLIIWFSMRKSNVAPKQKTECQWNNVWYSSGLLLTRGGWRHGGNRNWCSCVIRRVSIFN